MAAVPLDGADPAPVDGAIIESTKGPTEDGMGGGINAEADRTVKVTDFADGGASPSGDVQERESRAVTPHSGVETPKGKAEWDTFLGHYAAGQVHQLDFPVKRDDSQFPSRSNRGGATPLGRHGNPRHLQGGGPSRSGSDSSPDSSSADENGFKDSHRITSSSGEANQDPSIPNIAAEELEPTAPRVKEQYTASNLGGGQKPQQTLSRKHMGQLHDEQKAAAEEADGEESPSAGEGGEKKVPSSNRAKRRRHQPPQGAELNAERAAHSMASSSSGDDVEVATSSRGSRRTRRPPPPPHQRSYRSNTSSQRLAESLPIDNILAETGSNSSTIPSVTAEDLSSPEDRDKVRDFFNKHGYMPAPRQAPDALRRRLRVIRRLGLEKPDELHKSTLDRFTRLAVSIFKTKRALVSVIGRERQVFLSEIGMGAKSTSFEDAFCCHTIIGDGGSCMVVPNAADDWRFAKNPLVDEGKGIVQFYAGAPLRVGQGPKAAIIGSMCIIDDVPRHDFDEEGKRLLADLAECAVSELELLYNQRATVEAAKLHQNFLRRSLKHRPKERAGMSRRTFTATTKSTNDVATTGTSSSGKRNSGADSKQAEDDIDIFDEACQEIRLALDAHAVAIVDLTQFHLFYPSYQSSTAGGSTTGRSSYTTRTGEATRMPGSTQNSYTTSRRDGAGEEEPYEKAPDGRAARRTYAVVDPMSAGRTPQVLFVPSAGTTTGRLSDKVASADAANNLPILGYSCEVDNFAFNFSSTPAGRKIVSDFIARNVKGRTVWYSRDDSEGVAESITHLMPPGTEASLAMPVFGFDGQVAFAVVGCWTDPLFSYPAGALQFVETIAGSLLASVMKERLHQAERAQLNFAAAASHELRTPLHQLNAAAALLRQALHSSLVVSPSNSPRDSPSLVTSGSTGCSDPLSDRCPTSPIDSRTQPTRLSRDDRKEAAAHLEVIESNGDALGQILENIIDTLDIGRAVSTGRPNGPEGLNLAAALQPMVPDEMYNLSDVLEGVVKNAIMHESKARRVAGEKGLEDVEILLEVMPRLRGRWILATDPGPLSRALSKIISNALKFTDTGYIHITVQDMSRDVVLPGGYDNSIKLSQVVFDIKDTGRGMSADFLDQTILRPFAKADPFTPGAGLGLGLAQRMIEILGGKLAIKSTLDKGTLVHIELPLHLLNADNDSDLDDLIRQSDHYVSRAFSPSRQDGIYLTGFDNSDPRTRRVGRTLLRQLKLRFCRVVDVPLYASLIVVPEGRFSQMEIKDMVLAARPGVEVISLLSARQALTSSLPVGQSVTSGSVNKDGLTDGPATLEDQIKITYLARPLFPSVIRRILRPPKKVVQPNEVYVSDVTGGDEARDERGAGGGGSLVDASEEQIMPSPSEQGSPAMGVAMATLSDQWSTSSSEGSGSQVGTRRNSVSQADSHRRDASDDSRPPGSPTGFIKDIVSPPQPPQAERPHIETHITEPSPHLHESLSRMTLKSLHSEKALQTVADTEPTAMRVLVVEDNAVNRRIVVAMLKRTACRYAEAVDGDDAVKQFLSFSPDLVLLDLNMPVKDGFQAASEMRAIEAKRVGKRAKIIAVTALSQESSKRRGMLECGIDEWRTKPVSLKILRNDVESMQE